MANRIKISKQKKADSYTAELLTEIELLKKQVAEFELGMRYTTPHPIVKGETSVVHKPHNLKYTHGGLPIYRYGIEYCTERMTTTLYNPVTRNRLVINNYELEHAGDATSVIRYAVDKILMADYRPPNAAYAGAIGDLDMLIRSRGVR